MIALIDGDILVYRVGFTTEDVDSNIAIWRIRTMIEDIVEETGVEGYRIFLTSDDKSNYRYDIAPDYKANRTKPKPKHYHALRSHLIKQHNAEVIFGMEADDKLGIEQNEKTILCSIDKDLQQIPGMHYNFVSKETKVQTETDALRFFYKQILMGDNGDNIQGIKGIGPKKASKIIDGIMQEQDMYKVVKETYLKHQLSEEDLLKTARLVKIKQTEDEELWQPPKEQNIEVA